MQHSALVRSLTQARNWGAKSAFFHLGTNLLCTIWSYFRLPETGGLSFADLDILFANKVNARKFKDVVIHGALRTLLKGLHH